MTEKNSELTQLWEEAVNEYLNKSKRCSVAQRWKILIAIEVDLNNLIEQHESDFTQFQNSCRKFWDILMVTMGQLQHQGNVAQVGLQLTPFAPATVILKRVSLSLINSGVAVADCYDALEILFKRIRDITDRLDEYLKGAINQKLRKVVVKLLDSPLNVFCESEPQFVVDEGRR